MPQTMKKLFPFLSGIVLMFGCASALAQGTTSDDYPKWEIFGGFSALGAADSRTISFSSTSNVAGPGFETSLIGNFRKHFGIKGDFSAHFHNESSSGPISACPGCATVTQDFQIKSSVYNFLAGPEFKARNSTRFTPFAHVLGGVAHTSSTFTTAGPTLNLRLEKSDNSFAMAFGGGLDIRATRRVSIRGSMDYNPVFTRDPGSNWRNLARFSLGVLFH